MTPEYDALKMKYQHQFRVSRNFLTLFRDIDYWRWSEDEKEQIKEKVIPLMLEGRYSLARIEFGKVDEQRIRRHYSYDQSN